MAEEGALKGVLGRLQEVIKYSEEYSRAVEATSVGWMRALVVKDLGVAIKCVESLKRTRLGRAKIIPLDDLEVPPGNDEYEQTPGIVGPLSSVIKSEKGLPPAVEFVFDDTMQTTTQRPASLSAATDPRRTVKTGH